MKEIIKQIIKGCGTLPHVGEHPGTVVMIAFIILGAIAGGWIGAAVMILGFGPIYLWGAYERVKDSEQFERESRGN